MIFYLIALRCARILLTFQFLIFLLSILNLSLLKVFYSQLYKHISTSPYNYLNSVSSNISRLVYLNGNVYILLAIDYLYFYSIYCLKSYIYYVAGSRPYQYATLRREALELNKQDDQFCVLKANDQASDSLSLINYIQIQIHLFYYKFIFMIFIIYQNQIIYKIKQFTKIRQVKIRDIVNDLIKYKMLKIEQNQTESTLISLVDNLDIKQPVDDQQYILLIKKQPQRSYSSLYLTDCDDNFWLKKIDLKFIQDLKNSLTIKTATETFIKCLMQAFKNNCQINIPQNIDPFSPKMQYPHLTISLQIGQGLNMSTTIELNKNVNRLTDQEGHKMILKLFLRQLYESKQTKQKNIRKQIQALKQKKEQEGKNQVVKKDNKFLSEMFNLGQEKKDPTKNLKNRDLLNPNRQKRKQAGVKLQTPSFN